MLSVQLPFRPFADKSPKTCQTANVPRVRARLSDLDSDLDSDWIGFRPHPAADCGELPQLAADVTLSLHSGAGYLVRHSRIL